MNAESIAAVCKALRKSQSVPMPGGHGTVYERERQACPPYRDSPGLVARCLAMLGLLADSTELSEGQRAFVLQDWRLRVIDWFGQRGLGSPIAEADLALTMVQAMDQVVADWASGQPATRQEVAEKAHTLSVQADANLRHAMLVFGRRAHMLPWQPLPAYRLMAEARWDKAFDRLAGPLADEALAALFLHLLHATLGIRQPVTDLPNLDPDGREFYARVVGLLHQVRCRDHELAQSIGAVIDRTALVRGPGATLLLAPVVADLPQCFRIHSRGSIPGVTLGWPEAGASAAADLVRSTEWLATTITNSIIDALRLRPSDDVPGFTSGHCRWLTERSVRLPHLYLALRDGKLPELAQRHMALVHGDRWASHGPDAKPCALCHVEVA